MSGKTRSSISKKNKKDFILFDESSLNENDYEKAYQNYFFEKSDEKDMEDNPENRELIRASWDGLRNSRKKNFIFPIDDISHKRKRSHSCLSTSEKSVKISSCKKLSLDLSPSQVKSLTLNEDEQFFQLEVQRLIASPANYSFQPVCYNCETYANTSTIIRCTGVCLRYYHRDCVHYPLENPLPVGANFQCADCWTNTYSCILCKKVDRITSLLHCENPDCGRLYHRTCLKNSDIVSMRVTEDSIGSCPAHHCVSCAREDRVSVDKRPCPKLFQCIRCPSAFHDADLCMAAGSVELSLSQVVCPRHFENSLIKIGAYKPVHPDWCFKCFKPGAKLLCHYCPSSFHLECSTVSKKSTDTNVFVCEDCRSFRQPRYGEIVFVKVSMYRWWPSEIIHPRNAPMNILKMRRPDGTFPILFLGSQEYQWVARSRTISYNVAEKSVIMRDLGGTAKMDRDFTAGLEKAAMMHRVFVNILQKHVPLRSITAQPMTKAELAPYINYRQSEAAKRTVKYVVIKANEIVLPAKIPPRKPTPVCDCKDYCRPLLCSNYLSKVECDKDLCPLGNRCGNHIFSDSAKRNLGVYKTSNRGFGLKTMEPLHKNEFIIEYLGEVITKTVSSARIAASKMKNIKELYMVRLGGDLVVDAGPKGNLSRYINHSCDANCRLERWLVGGYARLGIFADTDVESGEELTFDYRRDGSVLKEDIFCLCGSQGCSGFLGPDRADFISPGKTLASPVVFKPVNQDEEVPAKKRRTDTVVEDDFEEKVNVIFTPKDDLDGRGGSAPKATPIKISKSDLFMILSKKTGCNKKYEPVKVRKKKSHEGVDNFEKNDLKTKDKVEDVCVSEYIRGNVNETPELVKKLKKKQEHIQCVGDFVKSPEILPKKTEHIGCGYNVLKLSESPNKKTFVIDSPENTKKSEKTSEPTRYSHNILKLTESPKKKLKLNDSSEHKEKKHKNQEKAIKPESSHDQINMTHDLLKSIESLKNPLMTEKNQGAVEKMAKTKKHSLSTSDVTKKERKKRSKIDSLETSESLRSPFENVQKTVESLTKYPVEYARAIMESHIIKDMTQRSQKDCLLTKLSTDVSRDNDKCTDILGTEKSSDWPPLKMCLKMKVVRESGESASGDFQILGKRKEKAESHEVCVESPAMDPVEECLKRTDALIDAAHKVIIIKDAGGPVSLPPPATDTDGPVSTTDAVTYESFCFRCFDGGELVLCDKRWCTKTYHLSCIGLLGAPSGIWYCPWHFCDVCGLPSEVFCAQCPSSYCRLHSGPKVIAAPPVGSRLSLCAVHGTSPSRDHSQ